MMHRRAMAPLVATFLLISFAIALGAVVMSFGSAYYDSSRYSGHEVNASELCRFVDLTVFSLDNQEALCRGGQGKDGFVKFILVNKANKDLSGVQMWVVGESIFVTDLTDQVISPGHPLDRSVAYNYDQYGSIRQVQFIPQVKVPGTEEHVFCFDHSIKRESIDECTTISR